MSLLVRKLPLALAFFFGVVLTTMFHVAFSIYPRDWSLSMLPICRIHHVNGLPTCRDCHDTSLGVCGRWRIRTSVPFLTAALAVRCFQPLSQPSFVLCISRARTHGFTSTTSNHHTPHCEDSPQSPSSHSPSVFLSSRR